MNILTGHILYLLGLTAFALAVPPSMWDPDAKTFIFIIGLLAIWRYGWAIFNWCRFVVFKKLVFPKWRRDADALGPDALPSHVYLLVTSFRIGADTTRRVYGSVLEEAIKYNRPVTIIASIVERADQTLIKQLFEHYNPPSHIKLIFVRIAGTGKRDALACGFRSVSRQCPPEDAVVGVIDGDSMLEPGLIQKCVPMFKLMPKLGALTTDELCEVEGNWLFKEWYNMRFAQRNVYMGSCSLSRRVLTLTGRMSMFRASIITDPEFINRVEMDYIDDWRLGRIRFLTGDDKSSWFHILSKGMEMIYIPDVKVLTIETPPDKSFLKSSVVLNRRWVGNMLRTNKRAIKLGPKVTGLFPWIAIIDQRINMWTSLVGPTIAVLATIFVNPFTFIYYLLWIAMTRYLITISLLASRQRVSAFYPFLLFYNQLVGSFIKTMVLFRLDKQKWTRQQTTLVARHSSAREKLLGWSSSYMHGLGFGTFVVALATISGVLEIPDIQFWSDVMRKY